jgi:hypothetical protein
MTRSRFLSGVGVACVMALGVGACGDDDKTDTTSTAVTTAVAAAPEDTKAPDAAVTAGLKGLVTVANGIAAIPDEAASKKASDGLEPIWMKVEGTVKDNEPDMYATIEEDLSLLESGDQAKAKTGADEMSKTVDAYLAKHPG